jgi:hypothetical protein
MRRALLAAAAACSVFAGCGGNPGDLLGMQISGGPPNRLERMHVTEDGRTSCNKGSLHQLPSATVLSARNVERDAKPLIQDGARYPAAKPGRRSFELRTPDGDLDWAEGDLALPSVLQQATLLALQLEQYCPR